MVPWLFLVLERTLICVLSGGHLNSVALCLVARAWYGDIVYDNENSDVGVRGGRSTIVRQGCFATAESSQRCSELKDSCELVFGSSEASGVCGMEVG